MKRKAAKLQSRRGALNKSLLRGKNWVVGQELVQDANRP